jgi:hypothetical protein
MTTTDENMNYMKLAHLVKKERKNINLIAPFVHLPLLQKNLIAFFTIQTRENLQCLFLMYSLYTKALNNTPSI